MCKGLLMEVIHWGWNRFRWLSPFSVGEILRKQVESIGHVHNLVMSLRSFLWPVVQLVLPSAGTSCILKGTPFGLKFELIVSLWRERWWFFALIAGCTVWLLAVVCVMCDLRHLWHLLLCLFDYVPSLIYSWTLIQRTGTQLVHRALKYNWVGTLLD